MATTPGPLYSFPWEGLGRGKYLLYIPFAVKAVRDYTAPNGNSDPFWMHMMIIVALRYIHAQLWVMVSRSHSLIQKHQIGTKGIKFEQVDRENHWDDVILLHCFAIYALQLIFPSFHQFPLTDNRGLLILLLLHIGPAEFVYYWAHRLLHHHWLYTRYHSHHHASFITEPISGSVHPFAEHLAYTLIFAIPGVGTYFLAGASIAMFYTYFLAFDFLNAIGHCNFEFVPAALYHSVPLLKYLIYTPTFHSLHHSRVHTNFCLFMPLFDYVYGTADPASDSLYLEVRKGRTDVPDCIFLAHGVDLLSIFHAPMFGRWFPSHPYRHWWFLWPLWPLTLPLLAVFWLFGKPFTTHKSWLRGVRLHTMCMPRIGFQYFLPSAHNGINRLIEGAIVDADARGVKVFGLGALNKNESLNGGGTLFLDLLKDRTLNIRLVHGNTLTAAVILNELPADCAEVFLTGATSKLGRAVALYLSKKGVRVMMFTSSQERFEAIKSEALPPAQKFLVQSTSLKDGAHCKTWILGKWLSPAQQQVAPSGTFFHQFVVPTVTEARQDCTYGKLAAMRLPDDMVGISACEMTMPRGVVHACHAGAVVHTLEGWKHHEVGAIDPDRIDLTWKAASKHGFRPA